MLRGKDDYGIMVLADRRFQKKRTQLPKWINQALLDSDTSLSTDMATASAKKFLRTMAQPFSERDQAGVSTWDSKDLERHKEKMEEEKIRDLRNGGGTMEVDGVNGVNGLVSGQKTMNDDFEDEDMDALMRDVDAE